MLDNYSLNYAYADTNLRVGPLGGNWDEVSRVRELLYKKMAERHELS